MKTQLVGKSMDYLRRNGWAVCKVEQTIRIPATPDKPASSFKRDAFGFGDILGFHARFGVALIQVTDLSSTSKHVTKILRDPKVAPFARGWLSAKGSPEIILLSWGLRGKKAARKRVCQVRNITLADFETGIVAKVDELVMGRPARKVEAGAGLFA